MGSKLLLVLLAISVLHDFGARKGAKAAKEGNFSWRSWRLGVRIVNY